MRIVAVLLVFFAAAARGAPSFWGSLRPGSHAAGFRVEQRESAPGAAGTTPRPIEISVWYPAARAAAQPALTFGHYFELAEDLRRRSSVAGMAADDLQKTLSVAITGDPAALAPAVTASILGSPMYARRDAAPAGGPFPVVLFSARYGTTAAQAVLAEYLASRGFVVAAVRPKDAREKLPFEAATAEEKLAELEAQTDDLRGALRALRDLKHGDDERAAVIAWSYAGESAWRLAQGDARIELVIALDSNVTENWVYQSREALAARESVPLRARVAEYNKRTPGLTGLAHGNFNALEGMIPAVAGIERVQPWSSAGPKAKSGYEEISRRVGEVLQATFDKPRPKQAWSAVDLRAADGAVVNGELYRPARASEACVALFHQSGSSRGEYRTIGPELARLGYTALAIDVRWGNRDRWHDVRNENAARHGTQEAFERRDQARIAAIKVGEPLDLDAAVDWLRRDGCTRVIAWGASIQANGALDLAARRPEDVAAIVDVSPGEYAKDDPDRMKTIAKRVQQPSFVIWGRDEESLSKPIFDALAGPKTSYGSTGRHGNAVFFEDPITWARLREFLAKHAPAR